MIIPKISTWIINDNSGGSQGTKYNIELCKRKEKIVPN